MAYRTPTSTIMLCHGFPCDKQHENALYFASKSAQWTYMKSLVKYTYTAQSYQRYDKNTLRIAQKADDLYDCNYLIFSNEAITTATTDVSGKTIFYAFVDSVEYINEVTTEVRYTLDPLMSFWFQFNMGECYVEREHTETDVRYGNLVPENINVNDYYHKTLSDLDLLKFDENGNVVTTDLWSVMFLYVPDTHGKYVAYIGSYASGATDKTDPDSYLSVPTMLFEDVHNTGQAMSYIGELRNKTYVNAKYFFVHLPPISTSTSSKIKTILASVASRMTASGGIPDAQILSVVTVPRIFAKTPDNYDHPEQWVPGDAASFTLSRSTVLTRPTSLLGPASSTYTPRNKKLLSYPFTLLKIDNNAGEDKEYAWEYLGDGSSVEIHLKGVINGSPETVAYPALYHGESNKYSENGVFIKQFIDTIWSSDSYAQFLASNKNSLMYGAITSAIGTVGSLATGNVGGAISGAVGIGQNIASISDKKSSPDKITGSISFSALQNLIGGYKYSYEQANIYPAAAARIDHYFDLYGYAIEDIKKPNIKNPSVTLRPHWNYIKTNGAVILPVSGSSIAVDEIDEIKKIFDNGVRFWSTPSEVGTYTTLSNAPTI